MNKAIVHQEDSFDEKGDVFIFGMGFVCHSPVSD
jgi:hypothetical protein